MVWYYMFAFSCTIDSLIASTPRLSQVAPGIVGQRLWERGEVRLAWWKLFSGGELQWLH